ncbi:MAG: amidohydrolase family protein [Xanthobacteraceae bacterium]
MANEVTIGAVALPGRSGSFSLTLRDGMISSVRCSEQPVEVTWVALPGLVNMHAHADRAFTVNSFRPRSFADALAASAVARAAFTVADVAQRALQLFERSVGHGVTRIRNHTDVDDVVEQRSMQGVLAAKEQMAGKLDVEVVAFSTSRNDLSQPQAVARLKDAVALGANLIGASLNSSAEPTRALAALFDLAEATGLPLDIHLDEHLEPHRTLAVEVADGIIARGLQGRVTLSHLCVLSTLNAKIAGELIKKLARAEITVVALPETNLYLQDRGDEGPLRRGLAPIRELRAAGIPVRLGTDNVRDWFFPFGNADMLDTALVAAMAAHLDDHAELLAASCGGRSAVEEGAPADIVLVRGTSFEDALARRAPGRSVFKAGRHVAGLARP